MKLKDVKTLIEASAKSANKDILNHNVEATFGEKSSKVVNAKTDQELAPGDQAAKKLPKKKRNGGDREVFGEAVTEADETTLKQYQVIDNQNGKQVGKPHKNVKSARRRRDKLDLAHGAIRYSVKPINEDTELETPEVDSNEKISRTEPSLLILHAGPDDHTTKLLSGKYSTYDKLKRIFSNFYTLILEPEVNGAKPVMLKYNKNGLQASIDDNDGEFRIIIKGLADFSQVKDFNNFLKTLGQ